MQNTRYTQVAYPGSAEYYSVWDHEANDYVREGAFVCGGFTTKEADAYIDQLLKSA